MYLGYDFSTKLRALARGLQVLIFNYIYRKVAHTLTEFENYKTTSQFENSLITKIFLFEFINSYNAIVYIAFFKIHVTGCTDFIGEPVDDCMFELSTEVSVVYIVFIIRKLLVIAKMYYDSRKLVSNKLDD